MDYINITASARLYLWDTLPERFRESYINKLNLILSDNSHTSIEFFGSESYETDQVSIGILTSILDKIVSRGNPTISDLSFEERLLYDKKLNQFTFSDLRKVSNGRLIGKGINSLPPGFNHEILLNDVKSLYSMSFNKSYEQQKIKQVLPSFLQNITSEEEDILYNIIGEYLTSEIQANTIRQPLISDLVGFENDEISGKRVDFAISYRDRNIVIEIDGTDHINDTAIKQFDEIRDKYLRDSGWEILRLKAEDVRNPSSQWLDEFEDYFEEEILAFNGDSNSYLQNNMDSLPFLMVLFPSLVQRTLKALIYAIRYEKFQINDTINILVLEEDVPTVCEAFFQLYDLWERLYTLGGSIPEPPQIKIDLIGEDPILELPQNERISITRVEVPQSHYNLCISNSTTLFTFQSSILENQFRDKITTDNYIRFRTAPIKKEYRKLNWSPPLEYDLKDLEYALVKQLHDETTDIPNEKYDALVYFLQNIFRKNKFWDGQARVISRLLQGESAIVLLPTGGGKSLTYQFAGLLLPGVTLIIDPLVSLMSDQVDNLNIMGFDRAGFISSVLEADEREVQMQRITEGKFYFIFVAPERMQIDEFRRQIQVLVSQYPVSLAVIDEVHCLSEWGHDFRPSYLHLGMNLEKYCTSDSGSKPTLVGLTGTASFAVLTDIQMELKIKDEEAIILPKDFDRKELIFHVEKTDAAEKISKLQVLKKRMPRDFKKNPQTFYQLKGGRTNSGLVFCPHVNGDNGVVKVSSKLGHSNYYSGSKPKYEKISDSEWREHKIRTQRDFKHNKIQELVATKSFGMGIDKPNIRYTIHYTIPHSVEAFYQEAGRAGRDGLERSAHCYIIYGDNNWDTALEIIKIKDHVEAMNRLNKIERKDKGDLLIQLWFLLNTYQDREKEKKYTHELWHNDLFPHVKDMPTNSTNTITIPFDKEGLRVSKEKAIFRLVLLGIIEGYSVNWRLQCFDVRVINQDAKTIKNKLKEYFLLYKFEKFAEEKTVDIPIEDISETLRICLDKMLNFVYDEIVEKRKQALRTIAEFSREFQSEEEFRQKIIDYLSESEFSEELKKWVNKPFEEIGFNRISRILTQVEDLEQAKRLVGTSRRMLDEDPSNVALRLLSCCARAQNAAESDASVTQECDNLIDQLSDQDFEAILDILLSLMDEINEHRKQLEIDILNKILHKYGEAEFTREYLKRHQDINDKKILGKMYTILAANVLNLVIDTNYYQGLNGRKKDGRN